MKRVFRNAINGAGFDALGGVVKTDAFGTAIGVDNINLGADRNGLVGAFRQAHIAIDAVFGDNQRHSGVNLSALVKLTNQ